MSTIDQRNHSRLAVDVPVTIRAGEKSVRARCMDLSSHGIHLVTPHSFPLQQRLIIDIEATREGTVDFTVTANVNRCTAQDMSTFAIGAEVIDIR